MDVAIEWRGSREGKLGEFVVTVRRMRVFVFSGGRREREVGVSGVYWPRRRRRSWIWIMNILARSAGPNILIQILGEAELWQTYGVSHLWRVYVYIYIYTPLVFRNRLERSVIYIWNITTVSTVIVILFRHATIPCLSFYARCVPFSIFFFR